jgi:nucleotide-binding universal stress UspA family protein
MSNDASPYRSILVPLDGSELAAEALSLAVSIARRSGAKLRLVLVHQHPSVPLDVTNTRTAVGLDVARRKAERSYLRNVQARLRGDGARVASAVTLTGAVGPALVTYVRDLGIDLVVMATHGRGGVRRAWLGSVADHLIRNLEIPVLLVRPTSAHRSAALPAPSQVLVPLDGSVLAEEALVPAIEVARAWDAELTLLRVVGPVLLSSDPMFPVPSAYDEDLTGMARDAAQDYLDDMVERLRAQGVRASGVAVISWNVAETILESAQPERVAMLAVATHGRGGVRRLVLGSVADKLVRGADVPVLVQRPGERAAAAARRTRRARPRKALARAR